MATTTTSNLESSQKALGIYYDTRVIESLQPNLYFEQFGTIEKVAEGNYTSRFFTFDQIATSSVSSLTEGAAPTSIAVSVSATDVTPTQYGVVVEMTDLVALTSVFDLINASLVEVGKAMARKIDVAIQTVVNAGSNVIYADDVADRASLGSSNTLDVTELIKAGQYLRGKSAPEYKGGGFACPMHPNVAYDIMSDTGTGQWIDVHKYASPDNIFKGEVGAINGLRIVQTPNIQTFSSTVTVYPTTVIGADAYRISYWLPSKIKSYVLPPENASTVSNPLGQKGTVGAKTVMGVAITQQDRLVRIESAATAVV